MDRVFGRYIRVPFFKLYWKVVKSRRSRSRVLVIHDNQILLIRHISSNVWSLPGGMVNNGETFLEAGVRELREELGITDFVFHHILGTYSLKTKKRDDIVAVVVGTVPNQRDYKLQWEIDEARWFPIDALPLSTTPYVKRRIAEYQSGARDMVGNW